MSSEHVIDNREGLTRSILATIAYFDVFSHPLTVQEIFDFNQIPGCTDSALRSALLDLSAIGLVHASRGFYFLGDDPRVVDNRIKANGLAHKRMHAAWFYSSLIARFPFVRAVMISGSLSKGVMDPDDDIDFFIITAPGRLWIARVLLTLFKRIFLLNSHRNFCLNYFVDNEHQAIPDHNIFTATEIGLILPMYNRELYLEFLEKNSWYRYFYPNLKPVGTARDMPAGHMGHLIEKVLSGKTGDRMDDFCLQVTRQFLARKYRDMDPERFQSDLETGKSISKHHPHRQQYRVLEQYQDTLSILENRMRDHIHETGLSFEYGKSA